MYKLIYRVIGAIVLMTLTFGSYTNIGASSKAAAANTYYVSVMGNDANTGTLSAPFKTIQKAIDTMLGGDTVYLRGGTYNEPVRFVYKTNTTGQYMTLINYPGEVVIVDGTGIAPNSSTLEGLIYIKRTNYVRISGLKIQHANMAGIYVGYSDHIMVDHNSTYDTVKSGISAWGATNVIIDGNDIALACNAHLPDYPMSEENISLDNVDGFEVKNNYVHQATNTPDGYAGGEGINMKDGTRNGTVHNNVVRLDERQDGKTSNRLAFGIDAWNNTIATTNIQFYNNVAYNSAYGFIVSSEQGGLVNNIKLYNNIAYNNSQAGFSIVWWSGTKDAMKTNIQFINNTSYHNGYGFRSSSPLNANVLIENNIFSQNTVSVQLLSGSESQFTVNKNLFYGSGGVYGTNSVIGDPKFVNFDKADFHLQSGSPAIDSGSSLNAPNSDFAGNLRPQGGGYDIGAYEYAISIPPTSTSIPATPLPATTTVTQAPTQVPTMTFTPTSAPLTATPTASPAPTLLPLTPTATATPLPANEPSVSTIIIPTNINVGEVATVNVNLNYIPVGGYTSAEFTCTYNPALLEASSIAVANLFGVDPLVAINGPQNGSFILAVAGSKGNRATVSGTAFTFSAKGLQTGQAVIECKARVSKGDNILVDIPSTGGANLTIGSMPTATPTPTNLSTGSAPTTTPTPLPTFTSTPLPATPTAMPALTTPTATPTSTPLPANEPSVSTIVIPTSINLGNVATVNVNLNNIPVGGYTSAEFTCTYNPALMEASSIAVANLFGADPLAAINGPQNGSFILAVAGSNSNRATVSGTAFTFSAKGLQAGQAVIECKARVSKGNNILVDIPSTGGANLTIGSVPTATPTPTNLSTASAPTATPSTPLPTSTPTSLPAPVITGQVLASKPVTIRLYNPDNSLAATVNANPDGTFNFTAPAGTYTITATASGFLSAQGSITLTNGNTRTMSIVTLPAGDIDGNGVIDQFDAMTIGMSYNTANPPAADLNNDGTINVLDLEFPAANYRKAGAVAWQ